MAWNQGERQKFVSAAARLQAQVIEVAALTATDATANQIYLKLGGIQKTAQKLADNFLRDAVSNP